MRSTLLMSVCLVLFASATALAANLICLHGMSIPEREAWIQQNVHRKAPYSRGDHDAVVLHPLRSEEAKRLLELATRADWPLESLQTKMDVVNDYFHSLHEAPTTGAIVDILARAAKHGVSVEVAVAEMKSYTDLIYVELGSPEALIGGVDRARVMYAHVADGVALFDFARATGKMPGEVAELVRAHFPSLADLGPGPSMLPPLSRVVEKVTGASAKP